MVLARTVELTVPPDAPKVRLDVWIVSATGLSRTLLGRDDTVIKVDGNPAKKSSIARPGSFVSVSYTQDVFEDIEPEDIPLDVIYEDSDILVINKPQGMVVHPAAGNHSGTLVNALAARYGREFVESMSPDEEEDFTRPGIVHRLDKDTSGVMVVALNPKSHSALASQFAAHTVSKTYIAICRGQFMPRSGTVSTNIARDGRDRKRFCAVQSGGRSALTKYNVIEQYARHAYCSVSILTGRTHQIRVHMSSIGHPVLGDAIYARRDPEFPDATLMLHARRLEIDHPSTGERMTFSSPVPERFTSVLRRLESTEGRV